MSLPPFLKTQIQQKLLEHFSAVKKPIFSSIGGGSINDTYRIDFGSNNAFCKINSASIFPQLFCKEKAGLMILREHSIVTAPNVIACFECEETQVLILEWIDEGERTETFWKKFGEGLASLHQISTDLFGLSENNYMGSVPQSNQQHNEWISFFAQERLQPMVQQCFDNNLLSKNHLQAFMKLEQSLGDIFEPEPPSLLHGDLWSGNFMCNQDSEPVLIDPAVYYGHRSMDLAMTTLFGGFGQSFYDAYHHHFPLPSNYREQWAICNLYPLLIHLYLFGRSYLSQIENSLNRFS